jgi:hypothetical protein
MLPTVRNAGLAAITALTMASVAAAPAHAWGKNEQNFLKGVLATVAVGALIHQANKAPKPTYQPSYQPDYSQQYRPGTRPGYRPGTAYPQPPAYPSYGTSIYQTPAYQAFQGFGLQERRTIQRRLAAQGYYQGSIDGAFGPGTYRAVEAYARNLGEARSLSTVRGAFGVYDSLIY